ncbi:ceramide kinase isoform X2 [Hippocampus comes]|uniref:ceramide kinase isoform X2 n=1 Tax=Hippocampus comes TaxID=109280 RepID=UPI00094E90BD|nr:PREDICTED: ceramide kinase-like isoform X2 [Hippocampus comes]
MDHQHALLLSDLCHKYGQVQLALFRDFLAWKDIRKNWRRSSGSTSPTAHGHAVHTSEIVAVHKTDTSDQTRATKHLQLNPHAFTVFYVRRTTQHQWRCDDVTFYCDNLGLCQHWIQTINDQLATQTNRPKSLLVYINPYGGKRDGKHIYDQKVAPLFCRACIATDVIVTERANHARDHLKTEANLDQYDGVVSVGGDGMFNEILHGLVARTQSEHGIDANRPDAHLAPCSLRIGIIPAGSTDCICFATVGTNDPVTSALHIIVGDSQPMDVSSVHHNDTFLRYSVSLLGYGFYADIQTDSERQRWLGPARYDLSGVKTFLSHNYYEGTVSFVTADDNVGDPRDKEQCRAGCRVCQRKTSLREPRHDDPSHAVNETWTDIHGKFIAINAANMSCACPRSPQGLSPAAHLADGTADLILVRKCSRLDFFKHLLRHTNKEDQFDHSFVEVHRVRKFRFQPRHDDPVSLEDLSGPQKQADQGPVCSRVAGCHYGNCGCSHWTCDGEILPHVAIQVSVQCQLIRVFARGIEEKNHHQSPVWLLEAAAHQSAG